MTRVWHKARGYLAAGVALVACPCHLVVTIPLLPSLTAGTAMGVSLERNQGEQCPHINFFCGPEHRATWRAQNPAQTGRDMTLEEALARGIAVFGHLLQAAVGLAVTYDRGGP